MSMNEFARLFFLGACMVTWILFLVVENAMVMVSSGFFAVATSILFLGDKK